jgi:hypothetical protein
MKCYENGEEIKDEEDEESERGHDEKKKAEELLKKDFYFTGDYLAEGGGTVRGGTPTL